MRTDGTAGTERARRGHRALARPRWLGALVLGVLALASTLAAPACATEWGGIDPGVSTKDQVRQRYGAPTREVPKKVEGYDTAEWIYEAGKAPSGLIRMTVEFGVLLPDKQYKPYVVRILRLDPKPLVFPKPTLFDGWGPPDVEGRQNERLVYIYRAGLVVVFDSDGIAAATMYFTPPQPAEKP
jgi:hypothetical protein